MDCVKGEHSANSRLEEVLGKPFPVLNKGFIYVADYMGGDSSIVRAAGISYGKSTKTIRDDRSLIRYLFRHKHFSPFEFPTIVFHVKLPIFVMRQWVRHRMASLNEISLRYSEATDEFFVVGPEDWRKQSTLNKQGSSSEKLEFNEGARHSEEQNSLHKYIYNIYKERIDSGISRELARVDLPVSLYTQIYWKVDLRNLLHFLELRMESNAQNEIKEYATIIGNEFVSRWCPLTWEAFNDFSLNSLTFGKKEIDILKNFFENLQITDKDKSKLFMNSSVMSGGEFQEFLNKLEKLGMVK